MNNNVGIIGLGNVGSMLLNQFLKLNLLREEDVYIANRSKEKLNNFIKEYPALNICEDNAEIAKKCNKIFVCAEPVNIPAVILDMKPFLNEESYILVSTSMISHNDLNKIHNGKITIFMPTLISMVNGGVTLAYHNEFITEEDSKFFEYLMGSMSEVKVLEEEDINLTQNLTASFPGFFAEIMSEFVKAASKHTKHICDEELEYMLLVSLAGAPRLLLERNLSFEDTINRVSTKGGITYEGVKVYNEKLPAVFDEAFNATIKRYKEITKNTSDIINELIK
ncbi:pyrroline-5-carboxylate reductase [Sedimentibacter acidaminivorans]|uniref:Pyrroline-5-carboxylate reductase n=1 Tax=Sedimentibacter acidaminivorans TaxID=913099 RepID=A0ABS4GFZ7_9FIRM|nr:pyrroline-5-carboxylate reductase dimerization domain-containing protein [Sedimentibacter acidaminivorans]MBP1926617.1 pyrroline-5-carboxylate reductase [Sedimentibacter acidaminivorans]